MANSVSRRGFFAGLLGATVASVPARAGDAESRCPHYCDGVVWRREFGSGVSYVERDEVGCPFCFSDEVMKRWPVPAVPSGSRTTFVYDTNSIAKIDPRSVTITTYEVSGTVLSVAEPETRGTDGNPPPVPLQDG
jgi:hypothetical protein